jgi:hypothetical protein
VAWGMGVGWWPHGVAELGGSPVASGCCRWPQDVMGGLGGSWVALGGLQMTSGVPGRGLHSCPTLSTQYYYV